jgi:hypothetical protein
VIPDLDVKWDFSRPLVADPSGHWLAVRPKVTDLDLDAPPKETQPPPAPTAPVGIMVYAARTGRVAWSRDEVGQAAVVKSKSTTVQRGSGGGLESKEVEYYGVAVGQPRFSADGKWVGMAYLSAADEAGRIWVGRAADGTGERTFEVPSPVGGRTRDDQPPSPQPVLWRFSPDGRRLAALGKSEIFAWDLESGKLLLRGRIEDQSRVQPSRMPWIIFSRDGRRLATASGPDVLVWDVDGGALLCRLTGHEMAPEWAAFTPDGSRLITARMGLSESFVGEVMRVVVWDLTLGRELISIPLPPERGLSNITLVGGTIYFKGRDTLRVFDGTPVKE